MDLPIENERKAQYRQFAQLMGDQFETAGLGIAELGFQVVDLLIDDG